MSRQSYGVLVVGAGWVSAQHIAAYVKNPHARVVAICDRRIEQAQKRVAEAGLADVALYDNLEDALRNPGVDIVSICTPQHVHCQQVLATAAAGKHMLIEKPVGISVDELQTMRHAVRQAGVRTVAGFVLRWNPLFRTLKAMLADNVFGRPYYVETDYHSHNGSWWSGWNDARTVGHGVSAFLVGGCHAIDAMRWFACADEFGAASPVEVFAVSGGYRKGSMHEYQAQSNTWMSGQFRNVTSRAT